MSALTNISEVHVIGIGDDGAQGLSPGLLQLIAEADLLAGGERHLAFFPEARGDRFVITGRLADLVERLRGEQRKRGKAVVLASGDPLFYGIGGYLAGRIEGVVIHPSLSSVQLAFAKVGLSWQDAKILSLHGKAITGLAQRIDGESKVALLTDSTNTPAAIAGYLQRFGLTEYRMMVAENLGGDDEQVGMYDLEEAAGREFAPLNVVLLLADGPAALPRWSLGIEDGEFSQRKPDKGLITKREVRVLSLAELALRPDSIVWDIGACTASVAIEAAKIAREGAVFAIEKNEGDLANARENLRKFRTDVTLLHGRAPQGLEEWPDPDAVFIGGSGGEMGELLALLAERLRPGGRVVLNAATIETLYEATRTFKQLGFATRVTLVQTARSKPVLDLTRFEGMNPIYIITAWKETEETA